MLLSGIARLGRASLNRAKIARTRSIMSRPEAGGPEEHERTWTCLREAEAASLRRRQGSAVRQDHSKQRAVLILQESAGTLALHSAQAGCSTSARVAPALKPSARPVSLKA